MNSILNLKRILSLQFAIDESLSRFIKFSLALARFGQYSIPRIAFLAVVYEKICRNERRSNRRRPPLKCSRIYERHLFIIYLIEN